jgi:hypothetical protein
MLAVAVTLTPLIVEIGTVTNSPELATATAVTFTPLAG